MVESEFLFIGDTHLGLNLGFLNDLDKYVYHAVDIVLDYGRDNGIYNIIIPGDIFDNPHPSQELQCKFIEFLAKRDKFNFYLIPGNHDYNNKYESSLLTTDFISKIGIYSNIHLFMRPTITTINGIPFQFLPWPYDKRREYKHPTINVAHVPKIGAMHDNGRTIKSNTGGVELDTDNGDFWYIGHLHRYQEYKGVCYSGNCFQRTFGEPLTKGFVHATIQKSSNRLRVKNKFVVIQSPFELHTVIITNRTELRKFIYNQRHIDKYPVRYYRLIIKKNIALSVSFNANYPQVVKIEGFKDDKEMQQLSESNISLENFSLIDIDNIVFEGLPEILHAHGLNKKEQQHAHKIVEDLLLEIGN